MKKIEQKSTALGIELGSTRIKAVLAGPDGSVLVSGAHDWENHFEGGYWTYPLTEVWEGIQDAYRHLAEEYQKTYGEPLTTVGALGVSAMMHGYLPFDRDGHQLAAFRTWRNTTTQTAAEALTQRFHFNIPQRWSVAHLYQAILNGESHVRNIDFLTTLAGYVHWQLTGEKVLGIGDASGIFPIDSAACDYDAAMMASFDELLAGAGMPYRLQDLLPRVLCAGQDAGSLTETGAHLLDPTGTLSPGVPVCPPEGDAGTGMAATNTVAVRTGNVSAGTSIFCHGGAGKDAEKRLPRDRSGHHTGRSSGGHGPLQQLHQRPERLGEPVWPGGGSVRHISAGIPVVPAVFQCLAGGRTGLRRCGAGELLFRRGSDPL